MNEADRERFNKILDKYLHQYDSGKYPPWFKRKREGILQVISNPDFDKDISTLWYVKVDSIMENYGKLLGYFVRNYGVDAEIVETWLRMVMTGQMELMQEYFQLAPPMMFSDELEEAWPSDNPKQEYINMMKDPFSKGSVVNIRVGRSATKEDVKWLIDEAWDSDIEPRLNKVKPPKTIRSKPKYLRNSTMYYLHKKGMSAGKIVKYMDKNFPTKELVDETIVRKALVDFRKDFPDWFVEVRKRVSEATQDELNNRQFELVFLKGSNEHFTVK